MAFLWRSALDRLGTRCAGVTGESEEGFLNCDEVPAGRDEGEPEMRAVKGRLLRAAPGVLGFGRVAGGGSAA